MTARLIRRLSLPIALCAALSLSGCSGKHWYWPFGDDTTTEAPADPTLTGNNEPTLTPIPEGPTPAPGLEDPNQTAGPKTLPPPGKDNTASTDGSNTPGANANKVGAEGIPAAQPIREQGIAITELQMIGFDYDKADVTPAAAAILDKNAEWLLAKPGIQVQVEGHCDERGTAEYNYALGQKRADAVREYLVKKGIDPNTVHTISYGKDRPLALGTSDQDHAANRRAQFLIFQQ